MKPAWAPSMFTRWNARPRCQSEVCSSLMVLEDYRPGPTAGAAAPSGGRGVQLPPVRRDCL
ncbi:hypothetical protein GCM10010512_34380 [Streptomyces thermoviolaceus subsp. thermoviolaceus]|nr:hypothetical protein GCM10010512_34380 [Streptomyces thermoviolaceus subsp. thermoviolaceus]